METQAIITSLIVASISVMGWSLLYRETKFYRVIEHLVVGLSIGYAFSVGYKVIFNNVLTPLVKGNLLLIIPVIFGCLFFTRFSKQYSWLSRWSVAAMAGVGSGVAMRGVINAMITSQIIASAKPIFVADPITSFNNLVLLIGTIASISFFFFTFKFDKGPLGKIVKPLNELGRYFLMATLGAIMGADILVNMSFLIDRMEFLIQWPAYYVVIIAILVVLFDILRRR